MHPFRIRISVCLLVAGIVWQVSAQEPATVPDIPLQSDLEEMMQSLHRTEDVSELMDYFADLRQHPVNINTAGREELLKLLFLNDFQINSLLDYRHKTGSLYSVYELQLVYGFDREVIRRILPYITLKQEGKTDVGQQTSAPRLKQTALVRIRGIPEDEVGYLPVTKTVLQAHPNRFYQGDRMGLYCRYQVRYGSKLSAGILGEKDPGEPIFGEKNKGGFDFYSGYIQYQGSGILRQVNVGRYALRFGQGLVVWNGFHLSKSSRMTGIDKRSQEIRYASSSSESGYMNGVSVVLRKKNIEVIPFFSFKKKDASLVMSGDSTGEVTFPSFLTSGLHRTAGELQGKHSVQEWMAGMRISYRLKRLQVGVSSLYTVLDHTLLPYPRPDNEFVFGGKENLNAGMDYKLALHRIFLFGEVAASKNGAPALLQGLQWYFSPLFSFSLLGRYYRPDYQVFYANAFSETGLTRNESGLYMGVTGHFIPHVILTGYVDVYHFPWLRYQTDAPSGGTETKWMLTWDLTENFRADVQYKNESHSINDPESITPMSRLVRQTRDHLRIQIRYMLMPQLQAISRVDFARFYPAPDRNPEKGFLAYQALRYAPPKMPLTIYGRLGLFDTRFSTRIYTYENDLLYSFSTPSFTGRGIRWYVMVKYPLFSQGTLALRVARTAYSDRQSIGTGPDLISVPHKTEIKAQIRVRF